MLKYFRKKKGYTIPSRPPPIRSLVICLGKCSTSSLECRIRPINLCPGPGGEGDRVISITDKRWERVFYGNSSGWGRGSVVGGSSSTEPYGARTCVSSFNIFLPLGFFLDIYRVSLFVGFFGKIFCTKILLTTLFYRIEWSHLKNFFYNF